MAKARKSEKPIRNRKNFVKRMKQIQMNLDLLKSIKESSK